MIIIFFDFDLTLTENHSGGSPYDRNMILFDKIETENEVINILKKLTLDCKVFIVSQGNQEQINNYLKYKNIHTNVYGSSNENLMSYDWVKLKTKYINEQINKLKPDYHIFIDDDIRNITEAKKSGINSILAKTGKPLENLKTVINCIKLNTM